MQHLHALDANMRFDFLHQVIEFPAAKIVTGGEKMGGVEANAEAFFIF